MVQTVTVAASTLLTGVSAAYFFDPEREVFKRAVTRALVKSKKLLVNESRIYITYPYQVTLPSLRLKLADGTSWVVNWTVTTNLETETRFTSPIDLINNINDAMKGAVSDSSLIRALKNESSYDQAAVYYQGMFSSVHFYSFALLCLGLLCLLINTSAVLINMSLE